METVKKVALWAGIVLTGVCGIVLLGGGKIVSGTMLVTLTFVMLLPAWRRISIWVRVGLIVVLFGLVTWNISTTDLRPPSDETTMNGGCVDEGADIFPITGIKFVDQVGQIVGGFITQAEPS